MRLAFRPTLPAQSTMVRPTKTTKTKLTLPPASFPFAFLTRQSPARPHQSRQGGVSGGHERPRSGRPRPGAAVGGRAGLRPRNRPRNRRVHERARGTFRDLGSVEAGRRAPEVTERHSDPPRADRRRNVHEQRAGVLPRQRVRFQNRVGHRDRQVAPDKRGREKVSGVRLRHEGQFPLFVSPPCVSFSDSLSNPPISLSLFLSLFFHSFKTPDSFLPSFASLPQVPMSKSLTHGALLNPSEIAWLNDYHQDVLESVAPLLKESGDSRAVKWLERECAELAM